MKLKERSYLNVFGDGFSSFRDCVSSEFSWKDKLDSWLNLTGWKSSSFVESNEFWSFSGNSVESIVNERVHDVHGFLWDSDVWVDLLEDLVNIDWEGFNSSSSGFLVSSFSGGWCFSHFDFDLTIYYKPISFLSFKIIYFINLIFFFNSDWSIFLLSLPSKNILFFNYFNTMVNYSWARRTSEKDWNELFCYKTFV